MRLVIFNEWGRERSPFSCARLDFSKCAPNKLVDEIFFFFLNKVIFIFNVLKKKKKKVQLEKAYFSFSRNESRVSGCRYYTVIAVF